MRIVATTLTNLHKEPSFHTELLTQVTNGFPLEVLKTEGEWSYVRQQDGYEGWAYTQYLAPAAPGYKPTHLVASAVMPLRDPAEPDAGLIARVPIGTAVMVAERRGDWVRIDLVGERLRGGWGRIEDLRPMQSLPLSPARAREQIVADARRMTGVYYVWGGNSASGIDCSGLAQLCHKLSGYTVPRDARLQYPVGRVVEGPMEPGDLLFFCSESNRERVTHVGISVGGRRIIHSSRSRNGVYEDDLDAPQNGSLRDRFVGARSFLD
jgi:SH3-like domain-containing protein